MKDEKYKNYIINVITSLKQLAKNAKDDANNSKEASNDYKQGVLMGYYSILTLLKHQAFVFCIDQKELGLADMKPDVDLLGLHKNPEIEPEEDNWMINAMNEEKIKGYLTDTIVLLKAQVSEARKDADHSKEDSEEYDKGSVMAYYSLFHLLQQEAFVFGIDEKELELDIH